MAPAFAEALGTLLVDIMIIILKYERKSMVRSYLVWVRFGAYSLSASYSCSITLLCGEAAFS